MRIAFLYDRIFPESVGGVEHRNLELARALSRRGHQVTLLGPAKNHETVDGVEIFPLPRSEPYRESHNFRELLPWLLSLRKLPWERFDLLETANIPFLHLLPLDRWCRRREVPLLVTWYEVWGDYWSSWAPPMLGTAGKILEKLGARTGCRVCAISKHTARRLEDLRPGNVPVLPVGLDPDRIRRAAFESRRPHTDLVYAGRLIPEKRTHLILETLDLLRTDGIDVSFTVIGDGPARRGLENLAGELGLSVRFTGTLERIEEVWAQIARAEIAIQPSEREGFGIFPLEAMALGKPVIYCDSPHSAIPELVRDGLEGICCPPRAENLAEAILSLLRDPDSKQRLGRNGRRRSLRYDWNVLADRFEELVLQTVAA